ncbi:unnamed protein product [Chironomus riparius]|uniref:Uncharacterized protein n=1 Tax=Chironomus riparius TaxID=315576 RepID=A0A9N9WMF7_9DIPT|nr:unnamed protein product [Chironomus riparius]
MNLKSIFSFLIVAINFDAIFGRLSCNYVVLPSGYTCNLTINNPFGLNIFVNINGTHVSGYTDSDVLRVVRAAGSNTPNIPSIICSKFMNVEHIELQSITIFNVDDYSFAGCTALTFLTLAGNFVSTIHENAFQRNVNLHTLYLLRNQLTTLPENVFQHQQKLNTLWLDSNGFDDFPLQIFWPLTGLVNLDIGFNQFRTITPDWFKYLQNLRSLNIQYNLISDFPKNAFNELKSLNSFLSSGNSLTTIRADSFGFLPNLVFADVTFNAINAIDENFINNTDISRIDMRGNFCANKDIFDPSISRDIMRADLRECFNNFQTTMSGLSKGI